MTVTAGLFSSHSWGQLVKTLATTQIRDRTPGKKTRRPKKRFRACRFAACLSGSLLDALSRYAGAAFDIRAAILDY
ncbi:hypothetical protein RRG08_003832 [Elysia crispata]|uniref:Uncharacterized protein n=1 Tax=Elysia crispata TaxID=231223 RepID=A0AAE0ZE15_9GAST|nr:hypothetical protein RRG08_003832 [Elysia crispata]